MSALPPPSLSRDELLADLGRLSLTYAERTRLGGPPELAFVDQRVDALQRQRVWQPGALVGLLLFAALFVFVAGGAEFDPATWWPARPRGLALLIFVLAAASPASTYRALSRKLGIYRALRETAAPSPTDRSRCASV